MKTTTFDPMWSEEYDEEQDSSNDETEITFKDLYTPGFNMQTAIATIVNISEVNYTIAEIEKNGASLIVADSYEVESIAMDVIERIVQINKEWVRRDAIEEAAKELVAVRKAGQSAIAEKVHIRVLYEINIATDDEYLFLRKQIWEE